MSDHIPLEIQLEILKKLPVKSIIQFRSVSKQWKSLIESSNFISCYGAHHTHPHRLLLRYRNTDEKFEEKYTSFVDDNDRLFTQQEFAPPIPVLAKLLYGSILVGSSHGLLCYYGCSRDPINSKTDIIVLWNPSIRKSVGIIGESNRRNDVVVGFGVCPATSDPTIVQIRLANSVNWQVQIFKLSSGIWKIPTSNLPRGSIAVTYRQAVVDRFIYWIAYTDGKYRKNLIVSFDMISDEFEVLDLPDSLSSEPLGNIYISNLNSSVVVLQNRWESNFEHYNCHVWMMVDDVTKLFEKKFSIGPMFGPRNPVLGFRKNGDALFESDDDHEAFSAFVEMFESCSQKLTRLEIYGMTRSFFVSSYMESLLLLDYVDSFMFSS